jgi:hypothetical protein
MKYCDAVFNFRFRKPSTVYQKINVCFRVVIQKSDFSFKSDTDQVLIKFSSESLGGWDCVKHVMFIEK